MIKIIAGGKKHESWLKEAISEYEKRLQHTPYSIEWEFVEEEKLIKKLGISWPFTGQDYVIICDERGKNISSDEYSTLLENAFLNSKNIVILIGGAFGFSEEIRRKADFLWSFSKLVFPHQIARLIVSEQIYRAEEIRRGSHYHHA
ncbi:MAG: 23S rRNA (pseudouridine(1915)-N(3))-methyltransferase RlmH [Candidatus Saccharibacteria bacterium]|nr:23S rRNA (pseudouridine(1915)-N(3))-methyltransferase RlmH [Candidatus Saccharibacteria bacterium]